MTISENKIYPRTDDIETIYLKDVITDPNIEIGDYTMYNDFVRALHDFQKNNVLYHYPVNHADLILNGNPVKYPKTVTVYRPFENE